MKTKIVLSIILAIVSALFIGAVTGSWIFAAIVLVGAFAIAKAYANEKGMAFAACAVLATAQAANCNTKPTAGLEVDVYLANRDDVDWDGSTISGRTISALVMKAGKFLYKFEGLKTSNNSSIVMNQGKYDNNWIHTWGGVIFDNTAATKEDIIEKLAGANLVAIVRNKWKGTSSNMECELLGRYVGLSASGLEKKSDDADTQGAWKVTMSSPKDEFENNAGYIVWDTDQTTTLDMLDALTDES